MNNTPETREETESGLAQEVQVEDAQVDVEAACGHTEAMPTVQQPREEDVGDEQEIPVEAGALAEESIEVSADEHAQEAMQPAAIENIPAESEKEIAAKLQRRTSRQRKVSRRKRRKQAKVIRILNMTESEDIRYRGFLSYRSLRILAWVFFLASQVGLILSILAKMDAGLAEKFGAWKIVLPIMRNFMTPLFLVAAFATILNNSRKFSSMLCLYGGFALLFYALFCLLHDRYLVGIMMTAGDVSREEAVGVVDGIIAALCKGGYFSFNIFVDLFVCTLFTFFMVYRPKKVFVGKALILFRLLAVVPVAYEIASIVVKALASLGTIVMPTHIYPLLTTKPPMTFLVFVALTFFIKHREWLYRRNGKSHEAYRSYLGTNLNSLQFSSFVSTQFLVVAFLDLIVMVVLGAALTGPFGGGENGFSQAINAVSAWGFGGCFSLLFVTPFIMLFSYTRTYKDTRPDIVINIVGVIALVLIYLEGLYQAAIYGIDVAKGILEGMFSLA